MFRLLSLTRHFCQVNTKLRYRFQHGSFILPHPQKAQKGGEDAIYVSDNVLMVADGVGGWAGEGIDPCLYPRKLVKLVEELLAKDKLKYIQNPRQLVKEAVEMNREFGSSTVIVLTLNPSSGLMQAYYLGDSVYAIINPLTRGYRKASQQQYEFNFPYQVGTNGTDPEMGVLHSYTPEEIKGQEFVVVASDGVWDNVKDFMIYELVSQPSFNLAQKAEEIATLAKNFAQVDNYESPFYKKAVEAGIQYPKIGKLDDNSIIVASIIKEEL